MKLALLISYGLLAFVLSGEIQAQSPENTLDRMSIGSLSGWDLTIKSDGSGSLSFGANPNDYDKFPAGTFDIAKCYQKLTVSSITDGRFDQNHMAVGLLYKNGLLVSKLSTDKKQAYDFVMIAIQNLGVNKDRMTALAVSKMLFH